MENTNELQGINPNSQLVRKAKKKKKRKKENTCQRKTITHTRQYLHGLAICLRSRSCRDFTIIKEEYRVRLQLFLSTKHDNTSKSPIKNHATLFKPGHQTGSNKTRLHQAQQISHLKTSSIININHYPQKTISHPCNSSSYPQGRRPIEATHSFKFLIVTPLVNMFAGFLDPQIFSSKIGRAHV